MEWISVKEGLPPADTMVLCVLDRTRTTGNIPTGVHVGIGYVSKASRDNPEWCVSYSKVVQYFGIVFPDEKSRDLWGRVTHWMPLPAPPEATMTRAKIKGGTMKHTVSVARLRKMAACPDQVRTFAEHFGTGPVTVTRKRLLDAAILELDISFWFRHAFPPLLDDYWAKRKPLDDDYWAKVKPLDDDYRAKRKPLDDDYWAKVKPLLDDYRAKRALLIADLLELP